MFDNNRLQQLQRRSRAPAKATCSQQSGIHIEPTEMTKLRKKPGLKRALQSVLRRERVFIGLYYYLMEIWFYLKHFFYMGHNRKLLREYMAQPGPKKLQIGTFTNLLPGWLNTDLDSGVPGIMYLSAKRPFVMGDNSFDYVFSEHVIEHLSYNDALFMLREVFRILKPGGRVRIATPGLERLSRLVATHPVSEEAEQYVAEATNKFILDKYVQIPLHPSDVAQAPKIKRQLLRKKCTSDMGEGSERLHQATKLDSLSPLVSLFP